MEGGSTATDAQINEWRVANDSQHGVYLGVYIIYISSQ